MMSARVLSQLPVALLDDIARLVSREQLSALQEVLKREASPRSAMSAWPPKDPREVIEAFGDRPLDEVRDLLADVGLDDAVPLLDEAATCSAVLKQWNMTPRSIAFRTPSEPNSSTSTSSSDSQEASTATSVNGETSGRPDVPIVVDAQPISCPVRLGGTAAFYVGASCLPQHRIRYQWFKARRRMEGETREKLIIENVNAGHRDQYTCRLSIKELKFHVFSDWCELIIVDLPADLAMNHPSLTPTPPSILKHPRSKECLEGHTVTFTVDADGVPYPSFQWYKNGVSMEGKTDMKLKLEHVESRDSGTYCCSVENENGSVVSNSAQLRVQLRGPELVPPLDTLPAIPVIQVHPQSMEVIEGSQIQLKCHALAQSRVYYNWYKNGRAMRGSGDILKIPSARLSDSGQYSCRVFTEQGYDNLSQLAHVSIIRRAVSYDNGAMPTALDESSLHILSHPNDGIEEERSFYILAQPRDITVEEGQDAVFTCHAASTIKTVVVDYQWYQTDGQPLTKKGRDEELLTLSNVNPRQNGTTVYCRVSYGRATLKSNLARLTVKERNHLESTESLHSVVEAGHQFENTESVNSESSPNSVSGLHIVQQPLSIAAQLGNRVTLDCAAAGDEKLRYQWCKVDAPEGMQDIFNSDKSTLVLYSLSFYNGGKYVCKVTGSSGAKVTTNVVEITVLETDSSSSASEILASDSLLTMSSVSSSVNGPRVQVPQVQSNHSLSGSRPTYANIHDHSPAASPPNSLISYQNNTQLPLTSNCVPGEPSEYANGDDLLPSTLASSPSLQESVVSDSSSTLSRVRHELARCLFTKQPESQELTEGHVLRLTVEAVGFPVPSYQWYKDDQPLPTTSRVLVIREVKVSDAGIYFCQARNEMGIVRSDDAFIKVRFR